MTNAFLNHLITNDPRQELLIKEPEAPTNGLQAPNGICNLPDVVSSYDRWETRLTLDIEIRKRISCDGFGKHSSHSTTCQMILFLMTESSSGLSYVQT